jgi:uncharacterized protein (TIGR01777 family)
VKIVLAGGAGFIGCALAERLLKDKHNVVVLTRSVDRARKTLPSGIVLEKWDGATQGSWISSLEGADVLINLAGESVAARRWTDSQKELILRSRIDGTRALVQAIRSADRRPGLLLSASAVGFYGDDAEEDLTEKSPQGHGFLADTARAWEDEASAAESLGVRVVLLRISNVLGKRGGALPKLVLPFRLFVGGRLGSGRQWFPWIHLDDLVEASLFLIDQKSISGPVNAVAPEQVTMGDLAASIGRVLRKPSWVPVPAFILKVILGEMSEVVLEGTKILPQRLSHAGFEFRYPDLRSALADILR